MDVYLVALSATHYDLYYEVDDRAVESARATQKGWRARATRAFHQVLEFVEQEREKRHTAGDGQGPQGRWPRLRGRVIAWLAERIAEQRLLWHLRGADEATLFFPSDMTSADVQDRLARTLRTDSRRHLRWAIIDLAWYLVCLPLTVLPGPNLAAYYFVFRTVGHLFAWLGARHGQTQVAWHLTPNDALAELRQAAGLAVAERHALVHAIADRLHLKHLDAFLDRTLPAAA